MYWLLKTTVYHKAQIFFIFKVSLVWHNAKFANQTEFSFIATRRGKSVMRWSNTEKKKVHLFLQKCTNRNVKTSEAFLFLVKNKKLWKEKLLPFLRIFGLVWYPIFTLRFIKERAFLYFLSFQLKRAWSIKYCKQLMKLKRE